MHSYAAEEDRGKNDSAVMVLDADQREVHHEEVDGYDGVRTLEVEGHEMDDQGATVPYGDHRKLAPETEGGAGVGRQEGVDQNLDHLGGQVDRSGLDDVCGNHPLFRLCYIHHRLRQLHREYWAEPTLVFGSDDLGCRHLQIKVRSICPGYDRWWKTIAPVPLLRGPLLMMGLDGLPYF